MSDDASRDPRLTRRGLFRGFGTVGTVALVAGCKPEKGTESPTGDRAGNAGVTTSGAEPTPLSFRLNGSVVELRAEPRTTLAQALRLDLRHTGTKVSCDRGACGACMVLVDGEATNSCMTLAHDVAGLHVETVEGLGSPEALSPLQRAFVERDALQCGFCTSGMLMSCEALLRKQRETRLKLHPSDVKSAIAGNLCRCGTYPHVIAAVLDVAEAQRGGAA